jgi:hypothetical protein
MGNNEALHGSCARAQKLALAQLPCNAPMVDIWRLIGMGNNEALHGSCARAQKLYNMECEPFFSAGTPSVADRSRRAIGKAVLISHFNPFQVAVAIFQMS